MMMKEDGGKQMVVAIKTFKISDFRAGSKLQKEYKTFLFEMKSNLFTEDNTTTTDEVIKPNDEGGSKSLNFFVLNYLNNIYIPSNFSNVDPMKYKINRYWNISFF